MEEEHVTVRRITEAVIQHGLSPCVAICRAMGFEKAINYANLLGRARMDVVRCFNGNAHRIHSDLREDACNRLGVSRERFDRLIVELGAAWRLRA